MANSAATLDSIIIEVESNSNEASSGIQKLSNTLSYLKDSIKGGFDNINKLANALSSLKPASEGLSNVAKNLENLGSVTTNLKRLSEIETPSGLTYTITRLKELSVESEKLGRTSDNVANINKIVEPLASLSTIQTPSGLGSLVKYLTSLSNLGNLDNVISEVQKLPQIVAPLSSFSELKTASGFGTLIKNLEKLPEVMNKLGDTTALQNIGRVSAELVEHLKPLSAEMGKIANGYSALSSMSNTYGVSAQTVTRYTKQHVSLLSVLYSSLKRVSGLFKSIGSTGTNAFNASLKAMGKFNSKLKQTMLALIGTRSLFTMLRKAVSEYTSMDADFQRMSQNIWRAFGAQLAPIIEYAMNLFKQFVRVIYSVVYALTGIDLIAKANAKSMSGWGKSAKDTLGSLQKFDDLNVVEFPKDSGGGGGDNGLIDLDKIDLTPFQKIIDWVKQLRDAIKEALDTGKWYNVGKVFADGINMAIDYLLEKLPKIEKFFLEIAENFGEFLNGVIENVKWDKLGELISRALMIIPKSLEKLFTTVNWTSLGKAIDAFFEGFQLTGLVHSVMNALGAAVKGFFEMFLAINWIDVAKKIGDAIITFFSDLNKILSKIPWRQVGEKIGDAVRNFPWKEVWDSIVNLAKTTFNGLMEFVGGLFNIDAKGLEKVKDALIGIGIALVSYKIVQGILSIGNGLNKISKSVKGLKVLGDSFNGLKTIIGDIDVKLFGLKENPMLTGDIMKMTSLEGVKGALSGISSSLSGIVGVVGGLGPAIAIIAAIVVVILACVEAFRQLYNENVEFKNIVDNLSKMIKNTFSKVLEGLKDIFDKLIDVVMELYEEAIKPLFQLLVDVAKPFVVAFIEILSILWKNVIDPLVDVLMVGLGVALDLIVAKIKIGITVFKTTMSILRELWKNILEPLLSLALNKIIPAIEKVSNTTKNRIEVVKNALQGVKNFLDNMLNSMKSGFTGFANFILGKLESLINKIINGVNSAIRQLNKIKIKVPDGVPGIGGTNFGFSINTLSGVSLPRLETGTNNVPEEGIYHLHPGEAVVPKKYNPALGNGNDDTNKRLDRLIYILDNMEFTNIVNIGNEKIYEKQQSFNKFQQNKYGTIDLY